MKNGKSLAVVLAIIIIFSTFASLAFARPILPDDFAKFVGAPYYRTGYVVVSYRHMSEGWMYIELYNPNNQYITAWLVESGNEGDIVEQGVTPVNGTWKLKYRWAYIGPYYTYAAMWHTFGIPDPNADEGNLGSDWARNPTNSGIYNKATEIIGTPTTPYNAAYAIYSHVLSKFRHTDSLLTFRSDLELLADLNSHQAYYGVCRSDAVILTSYARSLGIPARIIHLTASPRGDWEHPEKVQNHYFAEFYLGSTDQWVPVDGDNMNGTGGYDWFGINQANQDIRSRWPYEYPGETFGWTLNITIVKIIPTSGLMDNAIETGYPGTIPYTNTL